MGGCKTGHPHPDIWFTGRRDHPPNNVIFHLSTKQACCPQARVILPGFFVQILNHGIAQLVELSVSL